MEKHPILQNDILRYKKNKFAANFALLALVFNCLYFIHLYAVHQADIYTVLIGGSVILNLFVLLAGFYSSEGIKGYKKVFAYPLFVLGGVQIVRIFIYPTIGLAKGWLTGNFMLGISMTPAANFIVMTLWLALSAACFIVSGVYGFIIARKLEKFQAQLDNGEIDIDQVLAEVTDGNSVVQQEANNG